MSVRRVAFTAAVLVGGMGMGFTLQAGPARAYEYTPHDLALSAQQLLEIEAALLVGFGAFEDPVPASLEASYEELAVAFDSMSETDALDWLDQVDFAGASVFDQLSRMDTPISQAVAGGMARFPVGMIDELGQGGDVSAMLPATAETYEKAIKDLRERDGAPGPNGALTPPPTRSAVTAPVLHESTPGDSVGDSGSEVASESFSPASTPGSPSGTGATTWWPTLVTVGLGVLAIVAATTLIILARRRRRSRPVTVADLVSLGRRISAAETTVEVWRAVLTEAITMVGAAGGAISCTSSDGVGSVITSEQLTASELDAIAPLAVRVGDSGQPALGRVDTRHAALVAVISRGRLLGTIIVVGDSAFSAVDTEALAHLAPVAATALDQADRRESLAKLTVTDALTALANRRRLDQDLALIDRTAPTAFVMIDIDHFKSFNDIHGHPAGDQLLQAVADVLADNVRPGDVVYRYGGEEFAVLLPGTDATRAAEVAVRLVDSVRNTDFAGGETQPLGRVTVSAGVASDARVEGSILRELADKALYEAKRSGRDRVVVAPWGQPLPVR